MDQNPSTQTRTRQPEIARVHHPSLVWTTLNRLLLFVGRQKIIISNLEAILIEKNGREKIVSINLAPLVRADGVVYIVGNLMDITERKEALEKLRQKNLDMEKDLLYAQMIISKLLPDSIPRVKFLNIEYRYMPLEAIGGDFFSFFDIDTNNLGVFIGDVAGHGVSAALFLSLLKFYFYNINFNFPYIPLV